MNVRVRAAYQHAEAMSDEKEVRNRDSVTIWLEHTLFIGKHRVHGCMKYACVRPRVLHTTCIVALCRSNAHLSLE